ncbi:MAG: hypothetical protein HY080_03085 [Gammaproteobacteria bacterium]|nr:hypothetical protein [Gammaproteobacteria bacterium]
MWINPLKAADWAFIPTVDLQAVYDDNLFLTTQNVTKTWSSVIAASVDLSRKMENTSLDLTDKIASRHYDYNTMLDRNDNYITLAYAYNGERYAINANGAYASESTLTSELADTGYISVVRKVKQSTLSPSFTYQLSQHSAMQLSYDYLKKNYDAPITEFADYTNQITSANYSYSLTESLQLQAIATRSEVDIPEGAYGFVGASLSTKTDNYQAGLSYDYAEDIVLSALYGKRTSLDELKYLGYLLGTAKSEGSTYNVSLTKTLDRATIKFQVTRDYSPAGNGVVYDTDRATVNLQYHVTDRNSVGLDIVYTNQKPGASRFITVHRTYYSVQPGYTWQVSENWSLNAYYRYSYQKYNTDTDAAKSNLISLSMSYVWPYYHF